MEKQQAYCAFISYRHQSPDQDIAKALHTAIENYGIPASIKKQTGRKKMGKVFRDQEELPLSADLGADIEAALDASEWFIAICSPRYLESKWCLRELEYFIERKGREHVLTVLVDGDPKDSFADALRYVQNADGSVTEVEPLAAAVGEPTMSGKLKKLKTEKLRILAPMLGVSFDDLKRRARQRRLRIAAIIAAAMLVAGTALGVFLTVNHIRNEALRREAEQQAMIAEEQSKIAEERRQMAEEQRILALNNGIGELIERSETAFARDDRVSSAKALLEALDLSDSNDGLRRDEILTKLRRTMLISPFSTITAFDNQNERIQDIVPLPDGKKAVGVVNWDHVALIDFEQNRIDYRVSSGMSMVVQLGLSPDGSRFVANYGSHATVWNTADGSEVYTYHGKRNGDRDVANVFFWRDADTLLVQDWEQFYFVNITDGSERLFYTYGEQMDWYSPADNFYTYLDGRSLDEIFTAYTDDFLGINVTPAQDWSKIMIGGKGGETGTLLIDENGQLVCPLTYLPATFFEKNAVSPDGKVAIWLSWGGIGGMAVIGGWDTETQEILYLNPFQQDTHYSVSEIAFSPDSSRMAVVVNDVLFILDTRTCDVIHYETLESTNIVPSVTFSTDGKYIFLTDRDLFIFNAETFDLLVLEQGTEGAPYSEIIALEDAIFACDNDGNVKIFCLPELASVSEADEAPGELVERYYPGILPDGVSEFQLQHEIIHGYWEQNNNLPESWLQPQKQISREGDRAAVFYPDGAVELFDPYGDGTVLNTIHQLTAPITAFGMVKNRLVASDYFGRMMFYDLEKNEIVRILNDGMAHTGFAYTEDGSMLMALRIGSVPAIDVYSMEDGELLFTIVGTSEIEEFAFTKDGKYAVGVMKNGEYVVADLLTEEATLIANARAFAAR